MKKIVTFLFFTLLINVLSFAQTHIPDKNFANAIRQQCPSCIDMNDNLTAAAANLQILDVSDKAIKSLEGVKGFTNLTILNCFINQLVYLPNLPQSLITLNCAENQLVSLPNLPQSLKSLDCNYNQLKSLPTLPQYLTTFYCKSNELSSLPILPESLIELDCNYNPLYSLPVLPQSLKSLDCDGNKLNSLSALPKNLEILNCINNELSNLPILPQSLRELFCDNNKLTSLPALPQSLELLYCQYNQLSSLPVLSQNLKDLMCVKNQLSSLPILPQSLVRLNCENNKLNSLPALPQSLKFIRCSNNQLSNLPALPQNLITLFCENNQLSNLPVLPLTLELFECNNNQLSSLPALPKSLTNLICSSNKLVNLSALPQSLTKLDCSNNQLVSLPALPQSLTKLDCQNNKKLTCINSLLPVNFNLLNVNNTAIKCLPNKPAGISNHPLSICDAKNSGTCFVFPKITGNVFIDYNDDGIKNNEDVFVTNQTIEVKPYGYNLTNNQGDYFQFVDTSQTLTIKLKDIYNNFDIKPNERTLKTTSAFAQSYDKQDFRLVPKQIIGDMEVSIVSSVQRLGFEGTLTLTYRNIGTTVLFGQIKLEKDPILTYLSAVPKENAINGHTIIWDYSDLKPFETRVITVRVKVPTTTPINTKLTNKMFASYNVLNNYYETEKVAELTTVVGSYDPNDKTASVKNLDPQDIIDRKPITYTIRFQNTGTYHAERVEIQDTISSLFDLSTFKNIAVSHPNCTVTFEKDRFKSGQPTVIKWTFEPIFLPDSTANEPASHGFVRFSIQPKQGLPIGTALENKAYIYFDFNLPIITNTSTVKVEKTIKVKQIATDIPLKVYPNPSSDRLFVETSEDLNGELILTNLLGQLIEYQSNNSTGATVFDLQHLPKGVYILTLKTEIGNVSRKIVRE